MALLLRFLLVFVIYSAVAKPYVQVRKTNLYKTKFSSVQITEREATKRKPLVIVPGVLGSQLVAKLSKQNAIPGCPLVSDWFTLWLDPYSLVKGRVDCWTDNIRLIYNNNTETLSNSTGIEIKVPEFGNTKPFETLWNESDIFFVYFKPLVNFLRQNLKYSEGLDLFGAAYDWRLSPSLHDKLFADIKKLIEKAYRINNRKVVILAHSMGGVFANFFLNKQTKAWKKKYIDSFVSISSSFYGSTKSLKAVLSGDTENYDWLINANKMRDVSRTFPSLLHMLPRASKWPSDKLTVVETPTRNFTVLDYRALFERIGCKSCWDVFEKYGYTSYDIAPPLVPVHCIYSTGLPTYETLVYGKKIQNSDLQYVYGDGDGTINTWSSSACLGWKLGQPEAVFRIELPKNDHIGILKNSSLHNHLQRILTL